MANHSERREQARAREQLAEIVARRKGDIRDYLRVHDRGREAIEVLSEPENAAIRVGSWLTDVFRRGNAGAYAECETILAMLTLLSDAEGDRIDLASALLSLGIGPDPRFGVEAIDIAAIGRMGDRPFSAPAARPLTIEEADAVIAAWREATRGR